MSDSDNRQIGRDSLFLMADLRLEGSEADHRIKVRNLSGGGMMGEGDVHVQRGLLVKVNLKNCGWVEGSIAWVQGNRFGIAFREEIDPKMARTPVGAVSSDEGHTPRFVRPPLPQIDQGALRKI